MSLILDAKIIHLANNNFVKHSPLNTHYSAILYRQATKFSIHDEQLLLHLDTKFLCKMASNEHLKLRVLQNYYLPKLMIDFHIHDHSIGITHTLSLVHLAMY